MDRKTKPIAKSFSAKLERMPSRLGWVIIRVPLDVFDIWGQRGQLKVKGDINGFAFRTSLFPTGLGTHILLVNKRMQAGGKTCLGMVARFRLEPDTEERVVTVPRELKHALSADRSLGRWFEQLNYSARKEISDWVMQVKSAEARSRRADQIAERLLATKEAESELPPALKVAFARNATAYKGWQSMSSSQRRRHLMGIFYYRNPDARDRRIAKAMQDAAHFAEVRTKK